jgi:hypothetical protein
MPHRPASSASPRPAGADRLRIDGAAGAGARGDTLLVALLSTAGACATASSATARAPGFCLMGACQDCWVWRESGERCAPARRVRGRHGGADAPARRPLADDARPASAAREQHAGRRARDARVVVVVGAGPAGVRAAQALVQAGVRPIVIDEGRATAARSIAPAGRLQAALRQALRQRSGEGRGAAPDFDACARRSTTAATRLAWNLSEGPLPRGPRRRGGDARLRRPRRLLRRHRSAAAGAGWQRAGCYSLGAAQIALKAQACAIGRRTVFLGSGPLLYLVASQYVQAGPTCRRARHRAGACAGARCAACSPARPRAGAASA